MKKSLLFLLTVIIALTALGICSIPASAATDVDPNTLQPGSDRVFFIKDPDENGYLEGTGWGGDAENPLSVVDHENFDPSAEHPKNYLQTAFYQATEILSETGGTIVICGPVHLGAEQSYGSGINQREVHTHKYGANTIKFTSVYNGVDYRQTNGAKLTIETPAMLEIHGQSIWENIDIETNGTERAIMFNNHSTLVGEGVRCYPKDLAYEGVSTNYISLAGGTRYTKTTDATTNLTVKSGTYHKVVAGMWGVTAITGMENVTTNLVLEGNTSVLGIVIGTVSQKSPFSGDVNITINGGNYLCDIFAVGPTGMVNTDGKATIKINGGNFENCWSISATAFDYSNNAPEVSTLDLSDWSGSDSSYSALIDCSEGFTSIIEKQQPPLNGWILEKGVWYYYENGELVKNEWRLDSVGWCYLGATGALATNSWIADSVGWCYVDENGYCISNAFAKDSFGWAYVGADERMVTTTGWILHNGVWYYLKDGYRVENEWRLDSTGWCYLGDDGIMITNAWVPDSVGLCYVGADGYCLTSQWIHDGVNWRCVDSEGRMETNKWLMDSVGWCYVGDDGYCVTNCWKQDSVGWCYLDNEGRMITNQWIMDSTGWCYIGSEGYCLTGTQTIEGETYTFDKNGVLIGER